MTNIPQMFKGKALTKIWPYKNPQGEIIGAVARYDGVSGKDVVPYFKPSGDGFTNGGACVPRPLFGLEHLPQSYNADPLFIVEGEKCAAALQLLGLPCFTSCGGSSQVQQADWKVLDGYTHFIVLPDNDEAGEKYAQAVTQILSQFNPKPSVKWVKIPNLSKAGDVVDWLQSLLPTWNGFDPVPTKNRDAILQSFKKLCEEFSQEPLLQVSISQSDWEAPIALDDYTLPEWPKNILPTVIRDYVADLSRFTQTPVELVAMMTMAVLSTASAKKYKIQIKEGYEEPLNLWMCVALPPASRKTSILAAVTKPLNYWEGKKREEISPKIIEAKSLESTLKERIVTERRKSAKAKSDEDFKNYQDQVLRLEKELPTIPVFPLLYTNDVTAENLAVLLSTHDERMAFLSDEGGIFETMAGRYSGGVPNIDVYLQGHAASSVRVNRQGRDPVFLKAPCVTIGISPQPDVLKSLGSKSGFRGRGLLGRFLYAMPKSNIGTRNLNEPPMDSLLEQNYFNTVLNILNQPWLENEFGEKISKTILLSAEAKLYLEEFRQKIESDLAEGKRFGFIQDWAGKLAGAVARIAGVLHVARYANGDPLREYVSGVDMGDAIEIGEFLAVHALCVFDCMGADIHTDGARRILSWIRSEAKTQCTQRDCHRAFKSYFKSAKDVEGALQVLIDRHYLRQMPQPMVPHRPSKIFEVNPRIME